MFDLFDSWHELVTIAIILAGWALSWALITLCHLMQPSGRRWSYNSTTKGLHLNSRRWPKQSCALQFNLAGLLIILLAFTRWRITKLLPLKLFNVWRLKRFWKQFRFFNQRLQPVWIGSYSYSWLARFQRPLLLPRAPSRTALRAEVFYESCVQNVLFFSKPLKIPVLLCVAWPGSEVWPISRGLACAGDEMKKQNSFIILFLQRKWSLKSSRFSPQISETGRGAYMLC